MDGANAKFRIVLWYGAGCQSTLNCGCLAKNHHGMSVEIEKAKVAQPPIRYFNEKCEDSAAV